MKSYCACSWKKIHFMHSQVRISLRFPKKKKEREKTDWTQITPVTWETIMKVLDKGSGLKVFYSHEPNYVVYLELWVYAPVRCGYREPEGFLEFWWKEQKRTEGQRQRNKEGVLVDLRSKECRRHYASCWSMHDASTLHLPVTLEAAWRGSGAWFPLMKFQM